MIEFADARSYLRDLHEMVGPNYTNLIDGGPYQCYLAAVSIAAHILMTEERSTSIDHLCRIDREPIEVVPFQPAQPWFRHFVCVELPDPSKPEVEPLVYDPIFPEPLAYSEFLTALFRNPAEMMIRERMRYGP